MTMTPSPWQCAQSGFGVPRLVSGLGGRTTLKARGLELKTSSRTTDSLLRCSIRLHTAHTLLDCGQVLHFEFGEARHND